MCAHSIIVFEEAVDPARRSFFSEIVSSVSDVKFSHSGRYLLTRDYLTAKVWDLNMENKPVETYQVSHLLTHSNIYTNSHSVLARRDPSLSVHIKLMFWPHLHKNKKVP